MPGFDRSGPMGQGSQTGRGMGKCNPDAPLTEQSYGFGRGMGCRRGFGAGFGGAGRGGGRGMNSFGPAVGNRQPVAPAGEQETLRIYNSGWMPWKIKNNSTGKEEGPVTENSAFLLFRI